MCICDKYSTLIYILNGTKKIWIASLSNLSSRLSSREYENNKKCKILTKATDWSTAIYVRKKQNIGENLFDRNNKRADSTIKILQTNSFFIEVLMPQEQLQIYFLRLLYR